MLLKTDSNSKMADSTINIDFCDIFSTHPIVDFDVNDDCVQTNKNILGYTGVATSINNIDGVINLSSYQLSTAEHSILSKGSSFSPSPGTLDMATAMTDLDKFHRSLRLATRFHESDDSDDQFESVEDEPFSHHKFKNPSTYNPRGPPALECFILSNHVHALQLPAPNTPRTKSNVTKDEQSALRSLANNRNIVIKPADKGGGLVVMNTKDYVFEAHRQLNNTKFYRKIYVKNTKDIDAEINKTVRSLWEQDEIDLNCLSYLTPESTKPGRFYMLPKIHKNKLPPPGRPIVRYLQVVV